MPLSQTESTLSASDGCRPTKHNLSPAQLWLLDIMREHQFGRIENMQVHAGIPVLHRGEKIVRASRLGGSCGATEVPGTANFELKQPVCDLFKELARLQHGVIVSLEFRHGLPWLLETAEAAPSSQSVRV